MEQAALEITVESPLEFIEIKEFMTLKLDQDISMLQALLMVCLYNDKSSAWFEFRPKQSRSISIDSTFLPVGKGKRNMTSFTKVPST